MSIVIVIRAWFDSGQFRARAIMESAPAGRGRVVETTDSIDQLCSRIADYLRTQAEIISVAGTDEPSGDQTP